MSHLTFDIGQKVILEFPSLTGNSVIDFETRIVGHEQPEFTILNMFFLLEATADMINCFGDSSNIRNIKEFSNQGYIVDQNYYGRAFVVDEVYLKSYNKSNNKKFGYNCLSCNEYNNHAEINYKDKYLCYSCKTSYGWKYQ